MSKFLKGSVSAHLTRLTLPSIGGMFAIMVFNLTDTYFVSRLGTEELAAMGFTFSVVMIVGALSMGFSTGAASIITRALGAGDRPRARRAVSDGLLLTLSGALVVSLIGLLTVRPLFAWLGASGSVLDLVCGYMNIWYLGATLAILPPVSDGCLRASGDMVRPVAVMCICALLNVILDPILIFGWGPVPAMGIRGAAIATIIARAIAGASSIYFLTFHARLLDWKRPALRPMLVSWKQIIYLGVPAAVTQTVTPVAQGFYIRLAAGVGGVQAVAAMATGTRIEAFVFIVAMSYGIAIVPFVGQNYGAKEMERVQEARCISTRLAFVYTGISLLLLLPCARWVSSLFSEDSEVVRLSALYLILATFGHVGVYLCMWKGQILNVIGRVRPVMIINLTRVFVFMIPLCLLGSHLLGFTGLVLGIAFGNLAGGALAYWITRREFRSK